MESKSVRQFIAGGLAGCVSKTAIAPMDRVKILLQVQHPYYKTYGIFSTMFQICKREGVLALWKGNTMMMLRIFPYASIQFFAFEQYRAFYTRMFGEWHLNNMISGSSAGLTAVLCTYPMDMVRCRLVFQITGEHKYSSIAHAFKSIYREEGGIRGFYRGMSATMIGMIPYSGVSFYTFVSLKNVGIDYFPGVLAKRDPYNDQVLVIRPWVSMIFGGIAGAVSQTISFPLDVARRRMQLAAVLPDSKLYNTIWSTISSVYKADGISKGLFRGLSINYIRVVPQQAIAFTVYELLRGVLRLNKPNIKSENSSG